MLKELYNSRYHNLIINNLSFILKDREKTDYLLRKLFDKNIKEKKIFYLFYKYYKKQKQIITNEYRVMKRQNELREIIKDIDYNKNKYVDIGCEECMMPLSFGEILGIKNISCVNIENWESSYGIDKTTMSTDCDFKYYDGINLPYPDNSISVFSCSMVLHHIKKENRLKLIESIYNKLEKHGIIIIREHNCDSELMKTYLDFIHRVYDSIKLKDFLWVEKYDTHYFNFEELNKEFGKFELLKYKMNETKSDKPFIIIYKK